MNGELKQTATNSCQKAFEYLHEDTIRMLKQRYYSLKLRPTWDDYKEDYFNRVKEDALRLRYLEERRDNNVIL